MIVVNTAVSIPSSACRRGPAELKRTPSWRWLTLFIVVLGMPAMAGLQGCSTQQPDIVSMVMDAKTPADHEAIAAYYEEEAAANEVQASSHRQLAETYRQFHNTYKNNMAPHCEIAADYYSKLAAQDSALAQQHRKLAEDSQ